MELNSLRSQQHFQQTIEEFDHKLKQTIEKLIQIKLILTEIRLKTHKSDEICEQKVFIT